MSALVSIVLPTYNGARFLARAIESCLQQSFAAIELIVVDDGSREETRSLVAGFADPRLRYVRHDQNQGIAEALNTGFAQARGNYLCWTSDDNYYDEKAIEALVRVLEYDAGIDFVYADYYFIDGNDRIISRMHAQPPEHIVEKNVIGPCFLFRRCVYEKTGAFDHAMFLAEDYDYWVRVYRQFRMKRYPQALYYYRQHADSLTAVCSRARIMSQTEMVKDRYFSSARQLRERGRIALLYNNFRPAMIVLLRSLLQEPCDRTAWKLMAAVIRGKISSLAGKNRRSVRSEGTSAARACRVVFVVHELARTGVPRCVVHLIAALNRERFQPVVVAGRDGPLHQELRELGARVELVDPRILGRQNMLIFLRLIRSLEPELVHVHSLANNGCSLALLLSRNRFVWTLHEFPNKSLDIFERLALRLSRYCVTGSDAARSFYAQAGCRRIRVVPNGIPLPEKVTPEQRRALRARWDISPESAVICMVAAVFPDKGQHILIEAMGRVCRRHANVVCLLVGNCPDRFKSYRDELQRSIAENQLQRHIRFLGECADVGEVLGCSDVYAHASLRENFPLSVLEAMSHGLPVIATDVGGTGEMIRHGYSGMLVPAGDAAALAETLDQILKTPSRAQELGHNARVVVQETFTHRQMAVRYEAIYNDVITNNVWRSPKRKDP